MSVRVLVQRVSQSVMVLNEQDTYLAQRIATCGDKVYSRKVKVKGAPNFLPANKPPAPRL